MLFRRVYNGPMDEQGFGRRLRQLRRSLDMTQAQVGAAVKMTGANVSRIEKGMSPSVDIAEKLCRALGTTLADLMAAPPEAAALEPPDEAA